MSTSRTFLQNASTRHAIFVGRFAGSQIKEVIPFLERIRRTTISRLAQENITEINKSRLTALTKELDEAMIEAYDKMGKKLTENMKQFADYEADFSARMFTKATKADFTVPNGKTIEAAVFSNPIALTTDSISIEAALAQFSKQKRKQMINVIKDGIIAGRTSDEVVKDIDFVSKKIQRNHAAALVRTVTNHVSTAARQATVDDNQDVVEGVEWVSTLDGRTTHTCQSLDGKVFAENKGPRPPLHWGCRSTVIPKVKKEFSVVDKIKTERPAVGGGGAETVSGKTTYNSWLKKQSAQFQDEVLGSGKGKLFREGGLSVNQFVDANFQPLTLEQLRRKEPLAFEKAGLDD